MSSDGGAGEHGVSKEFSDEPTANIRVPRPRLATPPTPVDAQPIARLTTGEITERIEGANKRVADLHVKLEPTDLPNPIAAAIAGRLILTNAPTPKFGLRRLGSEGALGSQVDVPLPPESQIGTDAITPLVKPVANGTDSVIAVRSDQTASLARTDMTAETPLARAPWRDVVLGVTLGAAAGVAAASYLL